FKSSVYWLFRFGYLHDIESINKRATAELDTSRKTVIPSNYLCRMRPTQARMILRQLPLVDRHAEVRIRYARMYYEGLRDLPGLIIPPLREDGSNVYNYFPIQYPQRV